MSVQERTDEAGTPRIEMHEPGVAERGFGAVDPAPLPRWLATMDRELPLAVCSATRDELAALVTTRPAGWS